MASSSNCFVVLQVPGSDYCTIDIFVAAPSATIRKSMTRPNSECALRTVERLRMLFGSKPCGRAKTTREEILQHCPLIQICNTTGTMMDLQEKNEFFWANARQFVVGDLTVPIHYNLPTVTELVAPTSIFVELPALCPVIKTEFSSTEELLFEWGVAENRTELRNGVILGTSRVLFPPASVVGKRLFFRCRPREAKTLWSEVETPPVQAFPFDPAQRMRRWNETTEITQPPLFRVVSYNILHDAFCTTGFAKQYLYPFASFDSLDLSCRKMRIFRELKEYRADVMCLQECGKEVYETFLSPVFSHCGFNSYFSRKSGQSSEGICTLYRKERFEMRELLQIPLSFDTLKTMNPQVAAEIDNFPQLAEALRKVPSVGTVLLLVDKQSGQCFVVANTHLFYHADGCHIRALQLFMLLTEVQKMQTRADCEAIICGDFNFTRITGGYRLATTGKLEPGNDCWDKGLKFYWGMAKGLGLNVEVDENEVPQQSVPSKEFRGYLELPRGGFTDSHIGVEMRWTNYSIAFKEIIDHIFISSGVKLHRVISIPSEREITSHIGIPNPLFPSDHVALVVDVQLS